MSARVGEGNVADRLFIAQSKLEAWIDGGEVTFDDGVLTLLAEKATYKVEPAVRILSLIDGADAHRLLGRTVTLAELQKLGAEHYSGSVILGEVGYECEDGFVGVQERREPEVVAAPAVPLAVTAGRPAEVAEAEASDTDMLVDFLLKNL